MLYLFQSLAPQVAGYTNSVIRRPTTGKSLGYSKVKFAKWESVRWELRIADFGLRISSSFD